MIERDVLGPTLIYLGDRQLILADLLDALAARGIDGPILLRASEAEKLERILEHGTDRAGYPGDRRWRYDSSLAHEDLILATTPADNRADGSEGTSLQKLDVIAEPLLLAYAADALAPMRPKHYRFVDPAAKREALRAVFPVAKLALPEGWFRPEEGLAYRELAARALADPDARGAIVEVGSWLGRSCSYVAGACRLRGARLVCVDHYAGSSDRFDAGYRDHLAQARAAGRDPAAELRAHLEALGVLAELRVEDSLAAAADFAPGSVDLAFLDASHDRAAVAADIEAWLPALRPGGVLAGHDFAPAHAGVVEAVEAAARATGRALVRGPGSLWSL
ncbi:MAG: class I SAM-dependent methyltransferase [Myxococcales bacterium]|nr:class I SAM-dependent methyltransferase [Myxococcales bacterium]